MLPFSPPPMPMPMPGMPGPVMDSPSSPLQLGIDPTAIISMLFEMKPSFKPKYPYNFQKPKEPDASAIWMDSKREERRNWERTERMMDTIKRLRFDSVGIFPRDKAAREQKDQDEMILSDLVDDWQLLSAIMASFDMSVTKRVLSRSQQVAGQTLEDFAMLIREEETYRWANTGDMPLALAEAKVLTSYGQLFARVLCNLNDPDFPFDITLADPASCYPVFGGTRGLKKMYRLMRMSVAAACEEWGEPSKAGMQKIYDKVGKDDDNASITICEYADTWWRCATTMDGIELLPVTEHKYGKVPWIVQGGPAGEPLFTDTTRALDFKSMQPRDGIGVGLTGPSDDWGMKHKLVSSIHLQRPRHDQMEALMARVATSIEDSNNPALLVTRDMLLEGTPAPRIDRRRGAVNILNMGEQAQPIPNIAPPTDAQAFMQMANQDSMTGKIPLGMYGNQTGSQQTGNSMSVAAESGMDHITPWVSAMETFQTRKMEMCIEHWRNFGHLTRFQNGDEKPFLVPVAKPTSNEELARAITPEMIDEIGPRIQVTMTRLRTQELLQLAQAAGQLVPLGWSKRRLFEKMGIHDFDRMREEAEEDADRDAFMGDEKMRHEVRIPLEIKKWADKATDPDEHAMYMALLDYYMENLQLEKMQAAQSPPGAGASPGGGPMPMGGPPPPAGGSNTLNQAGLGAPPGSNGGQVGRPGLPPGPFGP
jgi:hypothetical protein